MIDKQAILKRKTHLENELVKAVEYKAQIEGSIKECHFWLQSFVVEKAIADGVPVVSPEDVVIPG